MWLLVGPPHGHTGTAPVLSQGDDTAAALLAFLPLKYLPLLHFSRYWLTNPKSKQGALQVSQNAEAQETHMCRGCPMCLCPSLCVSCPPAQNHPYLLGMFLCSCNGVAPAALGMESPAGTWLSLGWRRGPSVVPSPMLASSHAPPSQPHLPPPDSMLNLSMIQCHMCPGTAVPAQLIRPGGADRAMLFTATSQG